MKVSEIKVSDVASYIRLNEGEYEPSFINAIITAAIKFISSYTKIPESSQDKSVKTLDDYEDFYIVVLILCQDMHDNRTMYVETKEMNKTVKTILDMHCQNLIS